MQTNLSQLLSQGYTVTVRKSGSDTWEDFPGNLTQVEIKEVFAEGPLWEIQVEPPQIVINNRYIEAPVLNPIRGQQVWTVSDLGFAHFLLFDEDNKYMTSLAKAGRLFASRRSAIEAFNLITEILTQNAAKTSSSPN